jgi:lysophospholipase L1-like esterase
MCRLSAVNSYGVSGTRIAHQIHASETPRFDLCFCGRAYNMDTSADMVIVYGGVNDYIHGDAPFGQIGDTTPATFCGGVYFLMTYLKANYPGKPVIFVTPARMFLRHEVDDRFPSTHHRKMAVGRELQAYVDVIVQTGEALDIPVLDLYRTLGLDPHDEQIFQAYTVDGLHFNDAGHAMLANRLKEFIEAL